MTAIDATVSPKNKILKTLHTNEYRAIQELESLFTFPSSGSYHCSRPLFGGPGSPKTGWSLRTAPHIEVNFPWKDMKGHN